MSPLSSPSALIKTRRIPLSIDSRGILEGLPTTITSDGFTLEQIQRSQSIAIYRKFKPEFDAGFEVIKIRRRKARSIKGVSYPPSEVYPSSEEWGQYGWTYRTLREAKGKFGALLQGKERR